MTSPLIAQYSSGVMISLLDAAVRSIVLACLAALALAALRMRQVNVHLAVWTGVLHIALAMPLLVWLAPAMPCRIPKSQVTSVFPISGSGQVSGAERTEAQECGERSTRALDSGQPCHRGHKTYGSNQPETQGWTAAADFFARTSNGYRSTAGSPVLGQGERQKAVTGKLLQLAPKVAWELGSALARLPRFMVPAQILTIYILGLAFLLARLFTGFFLGRRLRRNLTPVDDPRALQWVELHARATGLKRAPTLAESRTVSVPLTVGVFHPFIVIPSGWREWPSAKLAAVIAHEISHIRRNDSHTRVEALVYQCFFWFSPLGWWLERHLADLAEQASDEAAIRAGAEPAEYAQILLSFFEISARQGRVSWQSVSMARGLRARKRIERVLASGRTLPAAIKAPILAGLALCALPIVWLTAATRPVLVASFDHVATRPRTQNLAHLPILPPVPTGPKTSHLARAAASELPLLAPIAPFKDSSFSGTKTGEQQTRAQLAIQGDSSGSTDFWLKSPVKASGQEMGTPYKKWLSEEVPYIITDAERAAFKKLSTDDGREAFIENFWESRNAHPGSHENEFKEEYYRRIAYANEHFASSIPGWKTDRGRIYIMYGPPEEIDSHHSGGRYRRPDSEGGGETYTFPFERWRCRYIDGIGTNIILEFVDAAMTGEYHLTMDPGEKDALLHVPGAGPIMPDASRQMPPTSARREDQAITMCVVIGNSGSMRNERAGVVAASLALVEASKPGDQVGIVDFNDEAFNGLPYGKNFTSNLAEMEEALAQIDSRGGSAMRDAIRMAIDQVEQKAHHNRKILVLITDGIDTSSKVTQEELIGNIKNSGVRLYCIALLSEDDHAGQAEAAKLALRQLAEASGGLAYYPKNLAEAQTISREIANEVRRQ